MMESWHGVGLGRQRIPVYFLLLPGVFLTLSACDFLVHQLTVEEEPESSVWKETVTKKLGRTECFSGTC